MATGEWTELPQEVQDLILEKRERLLAWDCIFKLINRSRREIERRRRDYGRPPAFPFKEAFNPFLRTTVCLARLEIAEEVVLQNEQAETR